MILAAGRARRYGGCKPLAPVGPHGEAVIDLVASDALAAGFTTIVLVLGPSTGPAIRYHVEHTWPACRRRALRHAAGATGHRGRRAERLGPRGRRPLRRGQCRRHLRPRRLRPAGRALRAHGDINALVGYRLADAVIGSSPVTRGICRVGDDGSCSAWTSGARSPPTPEGGFVAGDGREPVDAVGRRQGLDEPVGLHPGVPQDPPGRHGRGGGRLRGVRGPAPRGRGGSRSAPTPSRCCGRRAAASG